MNNDTKDNNSGADVTTSERNVIAVSFAPDNNAYTALTTLKELDGQGQLGLQSAAVIVRDEEGKIVVKDQIGADAYAGAAGGGVLGLLIGILGGPLGVLIGGTYGLMVGSLVDLGEVEQSESVLSRISTSARVGHTTLLAELVEQSPEVVDTAMQGLNGTILRRPVDDVEAEIAAAESAQRKAEREADKELIQARHQHDKEHVHGKLAELKAKMPHRQKAASV